MWSVNYKYEGELCHESITGLEESLARDKRQLERLWDELKLLAAATPPQQIKTEDGDEYLYLEYLQRRLEELREEMDECYWQINHKRDCLEALKENPKEVFEG